jgi:hypothetical protein
MSHTPEPEAVEPEAVPDGVEAEPGDVVIDQVDDDDPADADPEIDVELPQRPALDPEAGAQDEAPDA